LWKIKNMKQTYSLIVTLLMAAIAFAQQPILTGVMDATCSGGNPKVVEIYANGTVDFSQFTLSKQTNGGSFTDEVLTALGTVTDDFVYVYSTSNGGEDIFNSEFPSVPANRSLASSTASINGDDGLRLLNAAGDVVDQYGVTDVDGTDETWEYTNSYATRLDGTGPDGGFTEANWSINATNTLNGQGACNGGSALEGLFGQYSAMASNDPSININGAPVTGLDYFENNGPSDAQTFTVSGMNLTSDISLTADADFEISLQEMSGYSQNLSVSPTTGTVASTTIYVRLIAGQITGSYSGNVSVGATGATTETVAVSGEVSADDPFITLAGFVDGLDYNEGSGPSDVDTFGVSGMFLTSDVTITVDNGFELSLDEMGTFASSIAITPVDGTVDNVTVFVRLGAGEVAGDYAGTITATSAGADDQTLTASGTVNAAATCAAVGSIIVTEAMPNPAAVGDTTGEYFEIYNTTGTDIDIQSWILKDQGSNSHTVTESVIVPANGYVLLARSDMDNGGLTPDYVYGSEFALSNSSDEIIIECGGTSIDEVIYDGSWPYGSGVAMELTIQSLNSVANDTANNWQAATSTYGSGDLGTPGAVNDATLSIDSAAKAQFSLYPNPASSNYALNIDASTGGTFDVEIYSALGQRVLSQQDVSRTININSLNTGLYIVKITQGDASQTRKLVVK
jgi:hypothetical protein